MRSRGILVLLAILVSAGGTTFVGAQPKTTISLWYPAGDVAAGPATPLHDPALFQPFEAANNVKVDLVGLDYDTMEQKMSGAAAAGTIADAVSTDSSW